MRIALQIVRVTVTGLTHAGETKKVRRHYAVVVADSPARAHPHEYAVSVVKTQVDDLIAEFKSSEWTWSPMGDRGDCVQLDSEETLAVTGTTITVDQIKELQDWARGYLIARVVERSVYRALGIAWSGPEAVVQIRHKVEISEARDVCAVLWNHYHGFSVPGLWQVMHWPQIGVDVIKSSPLTFAKALEYIADLEQVHPTIGVVNPHIVPYTGDAS